MSFSRQLVLCLAAGGSLFTASAECVVLTGGKLFISGKGLTAGSLLIRSGMIEKVAADLVVPSGCSTVDVSGKIVTPGLIEAGTDLGLEEISLEDSTRDDSAKQEATVAATFRAADGYNPHSVLIPVARTGGITSAVINTNGGLIGGQSAWVDLAGGTQASAIKNPLLGFNAGLGHPAANGLRGLRELLAEVREFAQHRAEWNRGQWRNYRNDPIQLEALQPWGDGRVPLVLSVDRAADIEAVLRFAAETNTRVVLIGAAEGHMVAAQLAAAKVTVVIDPFVYGPESFAQLHGRRDNAALLNKAGVKVAIASFSAHQMRKLRQVAGNAVRDGLPYEAAIDAITSVPAQAFGMARYGTIAEGSIANLAVWSGDPLELATNLEHLYLNGVEVSMRTRQTELLDRYRKLPGTPSAPLELR